METARTTEVCRRYFEAWTSRDGDTARDCLAEDFVFESGAVTVSGRDKFLAQAQYPEDATTLLLGEGHDGDRGFQFYESTNGPAAVRVAEMHSVVDGRITKSVVVTDMAAFMRFMSGEAAPTERPW